MATFFSKLSNRMPDLGQVIKRFPVAAVIMACVTLYFMVTGASELNEERGLSIVGAMLSAYFAMMQTLWAEAREKRPSWILQIVIALAGMFLFYHSQKIHLNIVMLIAAVLLIIGNSVRFGRGRDDVHVWDFTHKIWTAAGFAFVGSLIYFLGVMAIMLALKSLFGLNIEKLIEHLILPIGLAFLAPLYWLANVPPVDEPYEHLNDNPNFVSKAVAFLGTWILSPLTLIYALILLAYALKILLQMKLPNGEIAQLTTPFLLIGTLTWLLLEPPFIQKNTLARLFRKLWFILSVPAAIMLAISVAVRVGEYGLTLERILLILACLWSLGLAAWFTFAPKVKRDIRIIPALAAVLFFAAAPTTHYLSNASQASRFESNLRAAGVLQADGTVTVGQINDKKAAKKALGALEHLIKYDAKKRVDYILRDSDVTVKDTERAKTSSKRRRYNRYGYRNVSKQYGHQLGLLDNTLGKSRPRNSIKPVIARLGKSSFNYVKKTINISDYEELHGAFSIDGSDRKTLIVKDGLKIRCLDGEITIQALSGKPYKFDLTAWIKNLKNDDKVLVLDSRHVQIVDTDMHKVQLVFNTINRSERNGVVSYKANFHILTSGFEPKP